MLDQLDAAFSFGERALDVRTYRQELLSSNIANADTPGYRARDVDFSSSLALALKNKQTTVAGSAPNDAALPLTGMMSGMTMVVTQPGHLAGEAAPAGAGVPPDAYGPLKFRIPVMPALDGNTVDLDTERVQFADNSLHYESLITNLSAEVKGMLAAITSGGS